MALWHLARFPYQSVYTRWPKTWHWWREEENRSSSPTPDGEKKKKPHRTYKCLKGRGFKSLLHHTTVSALLWRSWTMNRVDMSAAQTFTQDIGSNERVQKKTKTFHFYRATLTPLSQKIQLKNNLFLLRLIRDLPLWHFCNVPVIEDKTWTTPNDSHQFRTPDHKTLVRLARCFTRTPVIITRERKRPRPRNRHKQLYTQEKDGSVSCSDAHSSSTVNIITGTVCWRRYSEDISLWV